MIGKMIRAARKASGMTQREVALAAGVSPRAVWSLEQSGGAIATYQRVARVLDFRLTGLPRGASLGHRIAAARVAKGWSQQKLADLAKMTPSTVRALERGGGSVPSLSAVWQS